MSTSRRIPLNYCCRICLSRETPRTRRRLKRELRRRERRALKSTMEES